MQGGSGNDILFGGRGNDKYDGWYGDDTIVEDTSIGGWVGTLINNDDIISGGEGNDYIRSGDGLDRINAGPGNDEICQDGYHRDFSLDIVNCGSGLDIINVFYSGDGDTAQNCENVLDFDR